LITCFRCYDRICNKIFTQALRYTNKSLQVKVARNRKLLLFGKTILEVILDIPKNVSV